MRAVAVVVGYVLRSPQGSVNWENAKRIFIGDNIGSNGSLVGVAEVLLSVSNRIVPALSRSTNCMR